MLIVFLLQELELELELVELGVPIVPIVQLSSIDAVLVRVGLNEVE